MVTTVANVRAMSDEEVIREHDAQGNNKGVSSSFYLDELRRREAERAEAASYALAAESHNLARRAYWLAVASCGRGCGCCRGSWCAGRNERLEERRD
jgi:hypothetical protein